MDPNNEGKNLENRLKQDVLSIAYVLTPPTGYEPPEPPSKNGVFRSITRLVVEIMLLVVLTKVIPISYILFHRRESGRQSEKNQTGGQRVQI